MLPWDSTPEPPRTASCAAHGAFESRKIVGPIWSQCPACAKERRQVEEKREQEKRKAAEADRWQLLIGSAGIPERFRDRTLDKFIASTPQQRKALTFAKQYAERFGDVMSDGCGALFIGKPGTGKTHLAVGIALEVMQRRNASALYTTTMRAIRRVKDTWRRGSEESETQAIAALVFPDLLILDEVGVQYGSDTEKLILFDMLNERYEKRKPTLLLSNLTVPEVQGHLGERIFDRLREDGGGVVVFDWESHRGRVKPIQGASL
jgi:DNA replication protein DnaC